MTLWEHAIPSLLPLWKSPVLFLLQTFSTFQILKHFFLKRRKKSFKKKSVKCFPLNVGNLLLEILVRKTYSKRLFRTIMNFLYKGNIVDHLLLDETFHACLIFLSRRWNILSNVLSNGCCCRVDFTCRIFVEKWIKFTCIYTKVSL